MVISIADSAPFVISQPAPQGTFGRIAGGFTISGGLLALQIGLVLYTSSFIAEIIRAGIQSVGRRADGGIPGIGVVPPWALCAMLRSPKRCASSSRR